jgi:hypothetical protein
VNLAHQGVYGHNWLFPKGLSRPSWPRYGATEGNQGPRRISSLMTIRLFRSAVVAVLLAIVLVALAAGSVTKPAEAKGNGNGTKGAGGKAVAHYADGVPVRSAALKRKAPEARLFRVGLNSAEPTLGVTENGQVFYSALQSNFRIEVVRSKNGGRTWEIVSPQLPNGRNSQLLSLDPYVWVDDSEGVNRIYTIDLTIACSYLSFSDDQGKTWITNPLACGRPVNDHQTLFGGPPVHSPTVGYPNVVYYCWNDVGSSSCSKSLDGGVSFTPTGLPAFPGGDPQSAGGFCGGLHGHGHVGADGTVYIPRGYCGRPFLAISKDEGATWTRVRVAKKVPISGHEASVSTDRKGNIYYTWVGEKDRRPYLAVSKNGGKKWSKPMMIGPPGLNEANLPSLDVGSPGHVAVAYMGSENSPGPPFPEQGECTALGACPDPPEYKNTTWNGYMTESRNALDKKPVFYSATVNDKRDPLIRNSCGPGRCKVVYDFIDIVISPSGDVWSAWVDGCTAFCAMPNGTDNAGAEGVVGRLVR